MFLYLMWYIVLCEKGKGKEAGHASDKRQDREGDDEGRGKEGAKKAGEKRAR